VDRATWLASGSFVAAILGLGTEPGHKRDESEAWPYVARSNAVVTLCTYRSSRAAAAAMSLLIFVA